MNIMEFCKIHHITLTLRDADNNPNIPDPSMNHYRAILIRKEDGRVRSLTIPFSTGSGWTREPEITDVFQCLLPDYTTESFEDWANSYGYDEDSRSAEKTYRACLSHSAKLKNFLGELLEQALGCERE